MSKSVDISGYSEEFKQKVLEIYKQEKRQDYVAKFQEFLVMNVG